MGTRRIEVTEEHKVFSVSSVLFRAGHAPRRTASVGPGLDCDLDDIDLDNDDAPETPRNRREFDPRAPSTSARDTMATGTRVSRRISADASIFDRNPLSYREELPPIPPYTPRAASPAATPPSVTPTSTPSERPSLSPTTSTSNVGAASENPAQALADSRNALMAGLSTLKGRPVIISVNLLTLW
jgi:hypothetical protein